MISASQVFKALRIAASLHPSGVNSQPHRQRGSLKLSFDSFFCPVIPPLSKNSRAELSVNNKETGLFHLNLIIVPNG